MRQAKLTANKLRTEDSMEVIQGEISDQRVGDEITRIRQSAMHALRLVLEAKREGDSEAEEEMVCKYL